MYPFFQIEDSSKPKHIGKFGVEDLTIKNMLQYFLNCRWWRFFVEEIPMWKDIICCMHDISLMDQLGGLQLKNNYNRNDIVNATSIGRQWQIQNFYQVGSKISKLKSITKFNKLTFQKEKKTLVHLNLLNKLSHGANINDYLVSNCNRLQ